MATALARPLIDRVVPVSSAALRVPLQVALGVAFVAFLAQVEVRLPIGPVPITGQTLGVLLVGAAYGWRLGGATLIAYLLAGAAFMPVFSGGGAGWEHLVGPTAGYLVGFPVAAAFVGLLAQRGWDRRPWTVALAMVAGNVVIYALGLAWLSRLAPDFATALQWGLLPFLAGDAVKIAVAAGLLPLAWRMLGRR